MIIYESNLIMKKFKTHTIIFYLIIFISNFDLFSQSKTDILKIIIDEHIKREIPRLNIEKDEIIIIVAVSFIDEDMTITIDAVPIYSFPDFENIKKTDGVNIKFFFKNVPPEIINKIDKQYKTVKKKRKIAISKIAHLTHYKGICTFQVNKNNELYIITTPDDDYYYKKLKMRKLKFSSDLKFTKDIRIGK